MTIHCRALESERITDPTVLDRGEGNQQYGLPPLTNPDTEYWVKWNQLIPKLMQEHQATQINNFISLTGQALKRSLRDDTLFPPPPSTGASYEMRQNYLTQCFSIALKIALPDYLDPPVRQQQPTQSSLDCYRLLYRHPNLPNPSTTIRLLEILPGKRGDSLIEVRLFNANLRDLGETCKYEALSYAWGSVPSQRDLCPIRVNGLTHQISPNLHHALYDLRFADKGRTLWVDSICINQGNLKERAQQVMLMAKIFAKADRTVVYLGPSTPDTTAFFEYLNLPICEPKLCDKCNRSHTEFQLPGEAHAQAGISEQSVFDGFVSVCCRAWWERVWILQEYTLSQTEPMFYCGSDTVSNSLFVQKFTKLYDWAMRRRKHPKAVDSCTHFVCNTVSASKENDGTATTHLIEAISEGEKSSQSNIPNETCTDNSQLEDPATENDDDDSWESVDKHIPQQQIWKVDAVFRRRSKCRPWHSPDFVYMALKAQCTNPRDIVYGVRELMEPVFRDIFPSDYTIPLPKLYTTLATYLIKFNFWLDMFWQYPTQLRQKPLEGSSPLPADFPSWVPDFTKPTHARDVEKTPAGSVMRRTATNVPRIIDRVLFMRGWLLDEISLVLPLPRVDPFSVLQQLWYLERLNGSSLYTMIDEEEEDETGESRSSFQSTVLKTRSITPFASVAWATKWSDALPRDIPFVHFVEDLANFEGIPEAFAHIVEMTTDFVRRKFEREGKMHGPSVPPDLREEFSAQCDIVHDRIEALVGLLLRTWTDFVGICIFDFEGLRAQVCHRLLPAIPSRPRSTEENICDPPLANATLQMPFRYSSLLADIVEGTESEEEIKLREDVVMCMAHVIHDAAIDVVGGEAETTYDYLGKQDTGKDDTREHYFSQRNIRKATRISADESTETEAIQVIDDFVMMPLPADVANGEHLDGPRVVVWETDEKLGFNRKPFPSSSKSPSNESAETCDAELKPEAPLLKHPCRRNTIWRRIEKRTLPKPHMILRDLVDFLSGREFFITKRGLVGLTGPGTQGVCEGDDLFHLQNMAFPLIARLDPSYTLGKPKMQKEDQSTSKMQREIIGTAIIRDFDPAPSEDREDVMPGGFKPLGGLQPERFRFK